MKEAVWGLVAEKAAIWENVGKKESFRAEDQYEEKTVSRRERYPTSSTRKMNTSVTIK